MAELRIDNLAARSGRVQRIHPLSATIHAGQLVAVVGANGAGKSTLLRAIAGLIPVTGTVVVQDEPLHSLSHGARARRLAYLPQIHDFAWAMPVRASVALGLYAMEAAQRAADGRVDAVLAQCGIAHLTDTPVDRLSGGERALTALARVLIADTPILLLDEPVAALDIGRQYAVLDQLAAIARGGKSVIAVLHDLALVAQYADRIVWLDQGRLIADTPASQTAISEHAPKLLGRTPQWTDAADGKATPYFSR